MGGGNQSPVYPPHLHGLYLFIRLEIGTKYPLESEGRSDSELMARFSIEQVASFRHS